MTAKNVISDCLFETKRNKKKHKTFLKQKYEKPFDKNSFLSVEVGQRSRVATAKMLKQIFYEW